jgi:hypothetical protein
MLVRPDDTDENEAETVEEEDIELIPESVFDAVPESGVFVGLADVVEVIDAGFLPWSDNPGGPVTVLRYPDWTLAARWQDGRWWTSAESNTTFGPAFIDGMHRCRP